MKKIVLFIVVFVFVASGCSVPSEKIVFEVTDFTLEESISTSMHVYEGKGVVETENEGAFVVLIEKKKEGGETDSKFYSPYINVVVLDGYGEFFTNDSNYDENNFSFSEPKYEFEIIGYREYIQ